MAWPGGVILTPNKTKALAAFLARRGEKLSEDQQHRLRAEIQSAAAKNNNEAQRAATIPSSARAGVDDFPDDTEMTNMEEEEPQTVTSATAPQGAASTTPGETTNHSPCTSPHRTMIRRRQV